MKSPAWDSLSASIRPAPLRVSCNEPWLWPTSNSAYFGADSAARHPWRVRLRLVSASPRASRPSAIHRLSPGSWSATLLPPPGGRSPHVMTRHPVLFPAIPTSISINDRRPLKSLFMGDSPGSTSSNSFMRHARLSRNEEARPPGGCSDTHQGHRRLFALRCGGGAHLRPDLTWFSAIILSLIGPSIYAFSMSAAASRRHRSSTICGPRTRMPRPGRLRP